MNFKKIADTSFKHDCFKNSFFLSAITKWNKLDGYISNPDFFEVLKKHLLSLFRPVPNSICNIHNPLGVKYLTRLRIRFSHVKGHEYKHNFQDLHIQCAVAVVILKQRFISFSIIQILIFKDKPSDKIATIDANILTENKDNIVNTPYLENQIVKIPSITQSN